MNQEPAGLHSGAAWALWGGFGFVALAFTLFVVAFLLRPLSTGLTTVLLTYAGMMLAGAAVVGAAIRYAESALRARAQLVERRDHLQRKLNHEVRTLLNIIVGYTELAREEAGQGPPVALVRYLGEIEGTVMQLLRLSNDVLDMARLEENQIEISLGPVNLCSMLEDLKAATEPLLRKQRNRFKLDCGVPFLESDYTRLYQVLLNLITNANRFTHGGLISVTAQTSKQNHVDINVSDTGTGIANEDLERIFEPFVQTNGGQGDGSGLGLAVSREFAQALGGELSARSTLGEGSTFTLRLPVSSSEMHMPRGG